MPPRWWTTLLLTAVAIAAVPVALRSSAPAPSAAHCDHSTMQAVAGAPGTFRFEAARGARTLRWPPEPERSLAPDFVISGNDNTWEAPGGADTLVVPVGSRVRWHLVTGIHTITDGLGAEDPQGGQNFDYLLDQLHPDFDTTFTAPDTVDFFCWFHDPDMRGVLVVSANASVPVPPEPAPTLRFSRPPSPNPTRGSMSFTVLFPSDARVAIDVWDLSGRHVARLERGERLAGEHTFRWDGRNAQGDRVATGAYLVRVDANGVRATRRFSLLR